MFDSGITKRKWRTFALFSLANALVIGLFLWIPNYPAELKVPVIFLSTMLALPSADFLIGAFKKFTKIKASKRLIATIVIWLFVFWEFMKAGIPDIFAPSLTAAYVLMLYTISDFLSGLVLPASAEKSKSNKKKSKN